MNLLRSFPVLLGLACARAAAGQEAYLADLSLEELGNVSVSSVSGRAEPLSTAPASIYVITQEDIRRSGRTTLPEVLRLAPNLLVARVDTAQYAISARGFNSGIANKLLVLIDGRTVYSPLFSGVFWEMQDVMLEDVDRIEVISGPGGTLWGTNAVNGVVNIVTRRAAATQGTLVSLTTGSRESSVALRHGGLLGDLGHFRVYAKGGRFDNTEREDGVAARDDWERAQAGFRTDFVFDRDQITLQGDVYGGQSEHRGGIPPLVDFDRLQVAGANLLARWTRQFAGGSELRLRSYFDHTDRDDPVVFGPEVDIFDIELRHSIPFGAHRFLWGGGYRRGSDEVDDGFLFGFRPPSRNLDWANVFAQAEFALGRQLELMLGVRLEENDYTGTETLPSIRLGWRAAPEHFVWTAFSRAVRAPSRLDRDVVLPPPSGALILGGPYFESEVADVTELGYRAQLGNQLSFSATAFHYDWDKLRSGQPPPAFIENRIEGKVYGMESWASWQPTDRWRLSAGWMRLRKDLELEAGSTDPVSPGALGNDPDHQWLLRLSHNFGRRHEMDVMVRRVAELPAPQVPDYTAVDLNYTLRLQRLSLSLSIQNLFGDQPESGEPGDRNENPRGIWLGLRWLH